ncbi:MAG TPA: PKD domain-containing protein [Bacteroidales bacterium]|nr:PKD domain-containing protein [Bacteroidales bacterium]HPS15988.1 PKD domain-containing protein [Bacteroidales bacterium]
MKKLFVLIYCFAFALYINESKAQCVNADFSLGDFTNWTGSTGENISGVYSNLVAGIVAGTINSLPSTPGRQTIINAPGTDPNTQNLLSVLPPAWYSCRLGNDLCSQCVGGNPQVERLQYTYNVNSSNSIFTYQYALVFQLPSDLNHDSTGMPKFTVEVLNQSGNLIDSVCGHYEISAAGTLQGFQKCKSLSTVCSPNDSVAWKDWTMQSFDLSDYINQNVTIQFTTYDCAQGEHFGYAYISCYCGSLELVQQNCGSSDIVTAPAGFTNYIWSYEGTTINTVTNTITLDSVVNGTIISCEMIPVTGLLCTDTLSLILIIDNPIITFTPSAPIICLGESVTINASGGGAYVWSTGVSGLSITVSPASNTIYTVTTTTPLGCTSSADIIVIVNPLPSGVISSTPANCGINNGTITITPNVGTAPFTYTWSTNPTQTTQTAAGLVNGIYTVTITDANGCSSSISGVVYGISQQEMQLTCSVDSVSCFGGNDGSIAVTACGGTLPYTYQWNTVPVQTTSIADNLPAGIYTVTVTDFNDSTKTATINLFQPSQLQLTVSADSVTCYGQSDGSATVVVNGGTPPYNFIWNTSPPQIATTATGVSAGSYTVTVTDNNGCMANATVVVCQPTMLYVSLISENVQCDSVCNGIVNAIVAGGTPPYNYNWSNSVSSASIAGLCPGSYTITVTDANGCSYVDSTTVGTSNHVEASFYATPASGNIPLNVSFYFMGSVSSSNTYYWDFGDGNTSNIANPSHTYTVADNYKVELTVSNGNCSSTYHIFIDAGNTSCYAMYSIYPDTATLHHYYIVNMTNGVQPIKYLWSWGDGTHDTIPYPSHTYNAAGNYLICLAITDSNGCTSTYCDSSIINKSINTIISVDVIPSDNSGIIEHEIFDTFNIFPNPAKDKIEILLSENLILRNNKIEIYDVVGNLTLCKRLEGKNTIINIANLTKGLYYVKLSSEKGIIVKKFIKE